MRNTLYVLFAGVLAGACFDDEPVVEDVELAANAPAAGGGFGMPRPIGGFETIFACNRVVYDGPSNTYLVYPADCIGPPQTMVPCSGSGGPHLHSASCNAAHNMPAAPTNIENSNLGRRCPCSNPVEVHFPFGAPGCTLDNASGVYAIAACGDGGEPDPVYPPSGTPSQSAWTTGGPTGSHAQHDGQPNLGNLLWYFNMDCMTIPQEMIDSSDHNLPHKPVALPQPESSWAPIHYGFHSSPSPTPSPTATPAPAPTAPPPMPTATPVP